MMQLRYRDIRGKVRDQQVEIGLLVHLTICWVHLLWVHLHEEESQFPHQEQDQ